MQTVPELKLPIAPKHDRHAAIHRTAGLFGLTPFAESHKLIDSDSEYAKMASAELSRVATRVLNCLKKTQGVTVNTPLEYFVADEQSPTAYVVLPNKAGDPARIVVSRGLLNDILKNESQLAFVLLHEIRHVRFHEKFRTGDDRLENTSVEEYLGDVGRTVEALEDAGYAPAEAQKLFDTLEKLNQLPKIFMPWVAANDVHGLTLNRAKVLNGALVDIETARGHYRKIEDCPVAEQALSDELLYAALNGQHQSHISKIISSPAYKAAPVEEKFSLMLGEVKLLTAENAAARSKDIRKELKNIAKKLTVTEDRVGALFAALKESPNLEPVSFLKTLFPKLPPGAGMPILPKELKELVNAVNDFVSARGFEKISPASKKFTEIVEKLGDRPIDIEAIGAKRFDEEAPEHWREHIEIASKLISNYEKQRHHGVNILKNLWRLGINDSSMLYCMGEAEVDAWRKTTQYVSCAGDSEVSKASFDQARIAKNIKDERNALIASLGENPDSAVPNSDLRSVPLPSLLENFYKIMTFHAGKLGLPGELAAKHHEFVRDVANLFKDRRDVAPLDSELREEENETVIDDSSASLETDPFSEHLEVSKVLVARFDEMEGILDPALRARGVEIIRDFFLGSHALSFASLVGSVAVTNPLGFNHPLTRYILRAESLTLAERVSLCRSVEHELNATDLHNLYFFGTQCKTAIDMLRHLKAVGEYNEGAQKLARNIISEHLAKTKVGRVAIGSLISEFSIFFSSLHKLESTPLTKVMAHIERLKIRPGISFEELLAIYKGLEGGRLFPPTDAEHGGNLRVTLRAATLAALTDRASGAAPEVRRRFAELCLLAPQGEDERLSEINAVGKFTEKSSLGDLSDTMTGRSRRRKLLNQNVALNTLQDPEIRKFATTIWVDAIRDSIAQTVSPGGESRMRISATARAGLDDGDAIYSASASQILDDVIKDLQKRSSIHERRNLLQKLADGLELQFGLAQRVKDGLFENSSAQIRDIHQYLKMGEGALEHINQDPNRRRGAVQFLSNPLSNERIVNFIHSVDVFQERDRYALKTAIRIERESKRSKIDAFLEGELAACRAREGLIRIYDMRGNLEIYWGNLAIDFNVPLSEVSESLIQRHLETLQVYQTRMANFLNVAGVVPNMEDTPHLHSFLRLSQSAESLCRLSGDHKYLEAILSEAIVYGAAVLKGRGDSVRGKDIADADMMDLVEEMEAYNREFEGADFQHDIATFGDGLQTILSRAESAFDGSKDRITAQSIESYLKIAPDILFHKNALDSQRLYVKDWEDVHSPMARLEIFRSELWEFGGIVSNFISCRNSISPYASVREQQYARELYELFWSRDPVTRTVLLELLLFSPEEQHKDRTSGVPKNYREAFGFVVEQIFPPDMKYGKEAREILDIFLEETSPPSRSYILAALMGAAERIESAQSEYTAGKRLALILSLLGPAEKKLAQAINSHPMTPEDLRSDTQSIKSMSDALPRWEVTRIYHESVPRDYRESAVPRLGKTSGAASYYVTNECDDTILAMLRPYAVQKADSGLRRMERVAKRISERGHLSHIAEPFVESIHQARDMVHVETSHLKGANQVRLATGIYNGREVVVEGEVFKFAAAQWLACGMGFRHQQKVGGSHFLDLPSSTPEEVAFKRKAALANLTVELSIILSGSAFDHDRHGAQQKIKKGADGVHEVGLFDHGCMALEAPSEAGKKELAEAVCGLLKRHMAGEGDIMAHAHEQIRLKREATGATPTLLVTFERALLALNDYMGFDSTGKSKILTNTDLGQVLAAIFRAGEVDPVFVKAIVDNFGTGDQKALLKLGAFYDPAATYKKASQSIGTLIEEKFGGPSQITLRRAFKEEHPKFKVFDA